MWLLFGCLAIICALLNLVRFTHNKDTKPFMFASLAFTALTLCAFYSLDAALVNERDFGTLMDITPTASLYCWFLTIISILINGLPIVIPLFHKQK